jgi:hypothetical protein
MFRALAAFTACVCLFLIIPRSSCLVDPAPTPPGEADGLQDPVASFLTRLYRGVGSGVPLDEVVGDLSAEYVALTNALGETAVYDDLVRLFTIRRAELHAVLEYQDRLWDALLLLH